MISKTIKYRHPSDQKEIDARSHSTALSFVGHIPMTSQAEKDNCDLNVLVRRFGVGPLMKPVDAKAFGFLSSELDLRTALQTVADAESAFMSLPASVRKRFDNDPLGLLAAIQDPTRRLELEELGVFKAAVPPIARPDLTPPASIPPEPDRGKGG